MSTVRWFALFLALVIPGIVSAQPAVTPPVAPAPAPAMSEEAAAPAPAPVTAPAVAPDAGVIPVPDAGTDPAAASAPAPTDAAAGTAVPAPTTDEEALDAAKKAIELVQAGEWTPAIGLLLLVLIYLFNRMGLGKIVGPKAVPWVTAGIGVLGTIAFGVANEAPWTVALVSGFLTSASAIALWELIFKHFTSVKSDGTSRVKTPTPAPAE